MAFGSYSCQVVTCLVYFCVRACVVRAYVYQIVPIFYRKINLLFFIVNNPKLYPFHGRNFLYPFPSLFS